MQIEVSNQNHFIELIVEIVNLITKQPDVFRSCPISFLRSQHRSFVIVMCDATRANIKGADRSDVITTLGHCYVVKNVNSNLQLLVAREVVMCLGTLRNEPSV